MRAARPSSPEALIVAADIFGRTPQLEALAHELASALPRGRGDARVSDPCLVDPYGGAQLQVANESEAYAAFLAAGGMPAYAARLADALRAAGPGAALLGFSAGGAAAWLAACDPDLPLPRLAVALYAAQVRHHAGLAPRCPCRLIFPVHEEHFDVAALTARLRGLPNVAVATAPHAHGFMNPLSRGYDAAACAVWTARLKEILAASA